jgi:hypothetical protein
LVGYRVRRQELTLHCDYVGDEERLVEENRINLVNAQAISKSTELYRRMNKGVDGGLDVFNYTSDKKEEGWMLLWKSEFQEMCRVDKMCGWYASGCGGLGGSTSKVERGRTRTRSI